MVDKSLLVLRKVRRALSCSLDKLKNRNKAKDAN